jgi:hypothetical protein
VLGLALCWRRVVFKRSADGRTSVHPGACCFESVHKCAVSNCPPRLFSECDVVN